MNRTTRKELEEQCRALMQDMSGQLGAIEGEQLRREYAFTLLSRFFFVYFLQQEGFLDNNPRYLRERLAAATSMGMPFAHFFSTLTYTVLSTPASERSSLLSPLFGRVPYLSGSLFFPHTVDLARETSPQLSDQIFERALAICEPLRWTLAESGDSQEEGVVTPAFLATMTEQQVEDRKKTGSYYTPQPICSYIVEETCIPAILHQFEELTGRHCESIEQVAETLDARECGLLLWGILPTISVLDPAVGAGDFLIIALHRIVSVYEQVIASASRLHHPTLDAWIEALDASAPTRQFALRKRVAARNLFGVDIQQIPLDIAKLRLSLHLLHGVGQATDFIPLPNLDYALPRGNSLIGVARVGERETAQLAKSCPTYPDIVAARNALVRTYREAVAGPALFAQLREQIDAYRRVAYRELNAVLAGELNAKGSKVEVPAEKTGDATTRRAWTAEDIQNLDPLHFGFEFDEVMHGSWQRRLNADARGFFEEIGAVRIQLGNSLSPT